MKKSCIITDPCTDTIATIFNAELRLWDMPTQSLIASYQRAHQGIISSLVFSPLNFARSGDGSEGLSMNEISSASNNSRAGARRMLSCSTDRTVKLWDADPRRDRFGPGEGDVSDDEDADAGTSTITGGGILGGSNPWHASADASEVSMNQGHCGRSPKLYLLTTRLSILPTALANLALQDSHQFAVSSRQAAHLCCGIGISTDMGYYKRRKCLR